MTRDATLDAFATSQETDDDPEEPTETGEGEGGGDGGRSDGEGGDSGDSEGRDGDEGGNKGKSGEGTQAVKVTTDWTPAGATCAACGTTVERRWQHEGALVCPDCKDWRER